MAGGEGKGKEVAAAAAAGETGAEEAQQNGFIDGE